jgi:hypothetical protein
MSKRRTYEEINQEYNQLCGEYGHILHTITMLESSINSKQMHAEKISKKLRSLNLEADRAGVPKDIADAAEKDLLSAEEQEDAQEEIRQ